MTSNIEERLRAAYAAADAVLTEMDNTAARSDEQGAGLDTDHSAPPLPALLQRSTANRGSPSRAPAAKHSRARYKSLAPLVAAAAVAALVAGIAFAATRQHPSALNHATASATSAEPTATQRVSSVMQPLQGPTVREAHLLSSGRGWAITEDRLLGTDDYGKSWTDETPPGMTSDQLTGADVAQLDDSHTWIAAGATSTAGALTADIYRSGANGWDKSTAVASGVQSVAGGQVAMSVSFATASDGWLVISEQVTNSAFGALLRTTDGGVNWTMVASTAPGAAPLPAVGVLDFVSLRVGYMLQQMTGRAWVTHDGGVSWVQFDLPTPQRESGDTPSLLTLPVHSGSALVTAVAYANSDSGLADGVVLYESADDGSTWKVAVTPALGNYVTVAFAALPTVDAQVFLGVQVPNASASRVWTTWHIDKGVAKSSPPAFVPADVVGLSAADATHLWATVQSNGCSGVKSGCFTSAALLSSADDGHTWQQVHLPR